MKLSAKLLGAVCAVAFGALASTAASAAVSGTIAGSYANLSGGGASADVWGVTGALNGMFSGNWGVQANGAYHNTTGGGGDDWAIGGNVFWAGSNFKVNGQVMYHDLGGVNFTNYGAGAVWFAGSNVNLAVRGGGYSGTGTSGGYVGGDVDWYVIPNLAVSGRVDYIDIGTGFTTETGQIEWLFSSTTPVSLYGGYQHLDVGGSANVWFLGIKLYATSGGGDLVDRQRNGTLGYIGDSPLFIDQY